jgi:DNA-binding NarL/FixJ family response regulator
VSGAIPDTAYRLGAAIRIMLLDEHCSCMLDFEPIIDVHYPQMLVTAKPKTVDEAVLLLSRAQFEVVLFDADGIGDRALPAIAAIGRHSEAKVLIVSGLRDHPVHDAAILAGASGILQKQAAHADMLKAIIKVHEGELWVSRAAVQRVIGSVARIPVKCDDIEQRRLLQLTVRERQIVRVLSHNPEASLARIAKTLTISERTLRNHLSSIYDKLAVSGRLELYAYALKHDVHT